MRMTNENSKHPTPEFVAWANMLARCRRKTHPQYANYGGRGIRVCDRWLAYDNFICDMGRRPTPGHTIERKDNDAGYCPENCIWATRSDQAKNKRTNLLVAINGKTMCIKDWMRLNGIANSTYWRRIQSGMSPADAVMMPPMFRRKPF
jgi:hypothetical protein